MTTFNKISAWYNVIIRLLVVDLLIRVLALVVYPLAYVFRKPLRWLRAKPFIGVFVIPLWIFLDDTGDYGNEYECWNVVGCKPDNMWHRFKCAYYWSAIRNVGWNTYTFDWFTLKGEMSDVHFMYCRIYSYNKNLMNIGPDGEVYPKIYDVEDMRMNRAHFYTNDVSDSSNEGTYVDFAGSFFGKSLYYFRRCGRWLVLKSYCEIVECENNLCKIKEFNIGAVDTRILWRKKKQYGYIK